MLGDEMSADAAAAAGERIELPEREVMEFDAVIVGAGPRDFRGDPAEAARGGKRQRYFGGRA